MMILPSPVNPTPVRGLRLEQNQVEQSATTFCPSATSTGKPPMASHTFVSPKLHLSVTAEPAWSDRSCRASSEAGSAERTTAPVAGRADWKHPRCSTVKDCSKPWPSDEGAKVPVGMSRAEHMAPGGGQSVPPTGVKA